MLQQVNNQPPNKVTIIQIVFGLMALALILIAFNSCNSEKKALKPYKQVASDIDTNYQDKKMQLIAKVCNDKFPIEVKTIIHDSVTTKYVKVEDNAAIANLKALLANCGSKIDLDSFLNENMLIDTLYIDHYHNSETTKRDTIYNWRKANELEAYKQTAYQLQFNLTNKTSEFNDLKAYTKTWSYLGNEAWDKLKWWLLGLIILYVGYRILKSKFTLPF